MTARIYLVGTDTGVGKTTLCCALLRAATAEGIRALPFKPAVSGPAGDDDDPSRLARASDRPISLDELAPLRFRLPVAPGIADDPTPFLADSLHADASDALLAPLARQLAAREVALELQLTLIEGAGGLEVPMPGGSWQSTWISKLHARPLVVAADRLGTINHTLLTLAALRAHGVEPLGFALVELDTRDDPSRRHNSRVIERRSGLPCLARLPHLAGGDPAHALPRGSWHLDDLWTRLGL